MTKRLEFLGLFRQSQLTSVRGLKANKRRNKTSSIVSRNSCVCGLKEFMKTINMGQNNNLHEMKFWEVIGKYMKESQRN